VHWRPPFRSTVHIQSLDADNPGGNSAVDVVMNISTKSKSANPQTPLDRSFPALALWLPLGSVFSAGVWGNPVFETKEELAFCGLRRCVFDHAGVRLVCWCD